MHSTIKVTRQSAIIATGIFYIAYSFYSIDVFKADKCISMNHPNVYRHVTLQPIVLFKSNTPGRMKYKVKPQVLQMIYNILQ